HRNCRYAWCQDRKCETLVVQSAPQAGGAVAPRWDAVTIVECNREQDVLDALTTGQWPEHVDGDLRTHVATCTLCTDLVAAVQPLVIERDVVPYEPRIPSSAVMWWRAQMRARQ